MIRIGAEFAAERKRRNLTLAEVSKATKIREEFLNAIEKGEYKKLPSPAYAHGFVRNYAKFLGFHVEKSLALYRREYDEKTAYEVLPRGLTNPKEYSRKKTRIGRSTILFTFVVIIVGIFLLYQYRSAFLNPSLKVSLPKENSTTSSLTITVTGKTDPEADLSVDDEQVSLNEDGSFQKQITVFPGSTTITVKSVNKFGRTSVVKRDIIVKPGS